MTRFDLIVLIDLIFSQLFKANLLTFWFSHVGPHLVVPQKVNLLVPGSLGNSVLFGFIDLIDLFGLIDLVDVIDSIDLIDVD